LKCSVPVNEYSAKTKEWLPSKKPPCDLFCISIGDTPEFPITIIRKKLSQLIDTQEDRNKALKDKLAMLFRFATMSNRTSTMDEINYLVKVHLMREPRKTFYFPTTTVFMKISHRESIEDYSARIFANPIIDHMYIAPKVIHKKITKSRTPKKTHSFIETNELETASDEEVDSSSERSEGSDIDSERDESDYDDLSGDESNDDLNNSDAGSVVEEEFDDYPDDYSDNGSDY
jgi:hypothetical protein